MDGPRQRTWRKTWSTVQLGLLGVAVAYCVVMLVVGGGTLTPVYRVAAVFFGIALAGHITYLVLLAKGIAR